MKTFRAHFRYRDDDNQLWDKFIKITSRSLKDAKARAKSLSGAGEFKWFMSVAKINEEN